MRQAVIYDFHGTLADVTSLRPLLAERDFEGFYEGSLSCPPIESTVLAARHSHAAGYANLLLTGMPDKYAVGLCEWLIKNDVPIEHVWMRLQADKYKKDFIIKRRMYLEAVDLGYSAIRAYEDSPRVYDLWIKQGIPTELVPGYEEFQSTREVDRTIGTS